MFFRATFRDGALLLKTIGVIHELVDECSLQLDADGIRIHAIDSSHVSLVTASWRASEFDLYEWTGPIRIGMKLGNFLKILKCCGKTETVTLTLQDSSDDVLIVAFENETRASQFTLKLLDIEEDEWAIPSFQYDATIVMDSGEFLTVCKDLGTVADTTTCAISPDGLVMSADGDMGSAVIAFKNLQTTDRASMTVSFALRYLNTFAKGSVLASAVSLSFSQTMPLLVSYQNNVSTLGFYLAPKIDDDLTDDVM